MLFVIVYANNVMLICIYGAQVLCTESKLCIYFFAMSIYFFHLDSMSQLTLRCLRMVLSFDMRAVGQFLMITCLSGRRCHTEAGSCSILVTSVGFCTFFFLFFFPPEKLGRDITYHVLVACFEYKIPK